MSSLKADVMGLATTKLVARPRSRASLGTGRVADQGDELAGFHERDPGAVDGSVAYRRGGYRSSQLTVQLARYVKIRGDLAIRWEAIDPQDESGKGLVQAAMVCADFLTAAKSELESRRPNLAVVANLLGLADRMLVALYSPSFLRLRLHTVLAELRTLVPRPGQEIAAVQLVARQLEMDAESADPFARAQRSEAQELAQTVLKDAVSRIHGYEERALIEDDLQVGRLQTLMRYLVVSWLFLLVAVPFVSTVQTASDGTVYWPVLDLDLGESGLRQSLDLLVAGIGLSVVGAVGGVISGMLTVRDSKATLLEYRTSMKRLALRPAVGAVAALVLYLFLSANVISGVEVTSAGVYIVAAFCAGFSERYFLRIVQAQLAADDSRHHQGPARHGADPAAAANTVIDSPQ